MGNTSSATSAGGSDVPATPAELYPAVEEGMSPAPAPQVEVVHPPWRIDAAEVLSRSRLSDADLRRHGGRVRKFYERQNELIESMSLLDDQSAFDDAADKAARKEADDSRQVQRVVALSLFVNTLLLVAKVIVVMNTGSVVVVASAIDSLLDLLSGSILTAITRLTKHSSDPYRYPAGSKTRIEPIGLIVFASIMAVVSLQVIIEALQRLAMGAAAPSFGMLDILLLASVVGAKAILWFICTAFAPRSSAVVQALRQDHANDMLTNTVGAGFAMASSYDPIWFSDAVGAILFSIYIIRIWSGTALSHVRMLVGRSADPELLQQLTFVCFNHDERVDKIDTVRAYNFGANFIVEVDIVLNPEMSLREAHDIGEALQVKLERIPSVERCFVHLDYEWSHRPEIEHSRN